MANDNCISIRNEDRFSPLYLVYRGKWSLEFRLRPEPGIIFTGDEAPTTEELVEVLSQLNAPMWMIDVCKVVALAAIKNRTR